MTETTDNSNFDTTLIDAVELDLNDVDAAMARLEKGTYFNDEVTGAVLQPAFIAANPLARRNK